MFKILVKLTYHKKQNLTMILVNSACLPAYLIFYSV